ncbi:MAG: hypothetical protein M1462_00905 [Candidatus Thermoplasmatota archaeon]|uniref:hypothetical protein n=1 Tax=Ferroplasma sp. TaxID=2591003 RepID=UPI00262B5C6D|nr:hypothetical protein [Ferroplasma sp.]MCL4310975.1 hypothetical protein [Candidatus Thermoplasmatota archaeon]
MKKYLMPILAAIIFFPDFIMFYALRSIIYDETIFYLVIIFVIEILLAKFLKIYGILIFLLTILTVLLLYLKTLYYYSHIVKTYFYYLPNMPITHKLLFTAIIIIIAGVVVEALFTQKFWHLLSYYISISGTMLMGMATLAYMHTAGISITSTSTSYISSYYHVSNLEYKSIITLFEHGYQIYLPLYKLSIPMEFPISIGFMISVMGTILWLYLRENKGIDNIFGSFSIVLGLLIGYIFFQSLHYFISVNFEFLYISIGVVVTYILISYSNNRGKDIKIQIDDQQHT